MNLLPAGYYWYGDYFVNQNKHPECADMAQYLDVYKIPGTSTYKVTPFLVADVLLPLVMKHYRYEPKSKIWYRFNDKKLVDSEQLFTDVKDSMNDMKIQLQNDPRSTQYFPGIAAVHAPQFINKVMEILYKSHATHIQLEQFDVDNTALNTPDGYYNLLTRESDPNMLEQYCRCMTIVAPQDDQDGTLCPNYMNHLKYISQNDPEIMEYIEGLSGYILTGETFLQEFYWFYGDSKTGKSSIINVWRHIMGDYFWLASNTQFSRKHTEPHPELEIRLMGKRLVLIEELEDRQWNEAKLKMYTSGNPIIARDMGGKSINFMPTFKLVFTSNKTPDIDGGDPGIVERLRMLEFMKRITPEMKIQYFAEKCLYPEAPYILNRMMKAAQQIILKQALPPTPHRFVDATKQYIESNNLVKMFIDDECEVDINYSETFKNIQAAIGIYCTDHGYDPLSTTKLRKALSDSGHKPTRITGGRARSGLRLRESSKSKVALREKSYFN